MMLGSSNGPPLPRNILINIAPPPSMKLGSSNCPPSSRNILINIAPPPPMMLGSSNGPPSPRNISINIAPPPPMDSNSSLPPTSGRNVKPAASGDMKNELMNMLKDPNLKSRLKKAPTTNTRERVHAKSPAKKKKVIPVSLFRGFQAIPSIIIDDVTKEEIASMYDSDYISSAYMYRFDENLKVHVLDEIVMYKGEKFPVKKFHPFSRPEPDKSKLGPLEYRQKLDSWNIKKMDHNQSDSGQYFLMYKKLNMYNELLRFAYSQMQETMIQIRELNNVVTDTFKDTTIEKLRAIVLKVPDQIRKVASKIHRVEGIIIKNTDLKLTPTFIRGLNDSSKDFEEAIVVPEKVKVEDEKPLEVKESRNNRQSFELFGGMPMETVLPLLQHLNSKREGLDGKANRRYTLL
jgi:hypothetical protein